MIEVGMYVRTTGDAYEPSKIGKIKEVDITSFKDVCYRIDSCGKHILIPESFIKKYSFNLIDLIEVGDYVNGMRVKNIMSVGTSQYVIKKGDDKYVCCGDYGLMDDGSGRSCYALQWNNNQIKEVLTHEQYEANVYKLGDDTNA